jgi:hypothetical protein
MFHFALLYHAAVEFQLCCNCLQANADEVSFALEIAHPA